jgi:uncharacterized membrane protein YsdA (DUF1294 family)
MTRTYGRRPVLFHATLALVLASLLAAAAWEQWSGRWTWIPWLAAWLLGVNLVTLGYYGFDKQQARGGGRRVPERVLHGLALAGGSLGAYAGMQLFRHKTVKGRFRLVFWLIVVAQVGLLIWIGWEIRLRH